MFHDLPKARGLTDSTQIRLTLPATLQVTVDCTNMIGLTLQRYTGVTLTWIVPSGMASALEMTI